MDSLDSSSSTRPNSTFDSVERDVRALRLTVQIMLVSLVILSGSLGIYLFRQVSLLRRQAEASTRLAQQMAQHFNNNLATQAVAFEKQLIDFAQTNAAFHTRLAKYYASTNAPAASAPPPSPATPGLPGNPTAPATPSPYAPAQK